MTAGPPPPHGGQPLLSAGQPLGAGRAAMIMIHGRGAGPKNILDLQPHLAHPDFTYLAPAAAGGTWYPQSFMAPIANNEPGISSGIAVIHNLIHRAITQGIPEHRIILLGFSQGGCLTCTAAQRRPDRYGAVIAYSGGLIGPEGTSWSADGNFGGTPVFFGCSDRDAHVPETRVRESAAIFERMGATVTTRIYPGLGHLVNDDEIAFTRDLLEAVAES